MILGIGTVELLLIALGLSMDAFAVAVCKGLSMQKITLQKAGIVGLYFGFFQFAMPLAGFFLAGLFADKIKAFDHWIAFALLAIIGGKMLFEGLSKKEDENAAAARESLRPGAMLPMAVATSIDAMAVGVSFAFLDVAIFPAAGSIGVVTFLCSAAGVKLGHIAGEKLQNKATFCGGLILVLIGLKILLEHLGVISF